MPAGACASTVLERASSFAQFIVLQFMRCICMQAAVRKEVAAAIIKAVVSVKSAEITPDKVVIRFGMTSACLLSP